MLEGGVCYCVWVIIRGFGGMHFPHFSEFQVGGLELGGSGSLREGIFTSFCF